MIKRDQLDKLPAMLPPGVAPPEVIVKALPAAGGPLRAVFLEPKALDEWFTPEGWPTEPDAGV